MTHQPFDRVWSPDRQDQLASPLCWRKPAVARVVVDLFDDAPDEFIDRVFAVMHLAQKYGGHTFQVLTKRPERMAAYMAAPGRAQCVDNALHSIRWPGRVGGWVCVKQSPPKNDLWPPRNVWLGTSVEDQRSADERIPHLLATPAEVRFLSCEPLLGPVNLRYGPLPSLDLVIVGGESGPKARPCDVAWVRSIVQQCAAAGVACWVKQLGARCVTRHPMDPAALPPVRFCDRKGADMAEWPEDLRVRQVPEVTR